MKALYLKKIRSGWILLTVSIFFFPELFGQLKPDNGLEDFIVEAMTENHVPGLAFAIVHDGTIINQGFYGKANLSWDTMVDENTVFQTASCSKLFCALLVGRLIDAGLLNHENTLGEVLDSVPDAWSSITIRQLASHQSGISIVDFSDHTTTRESVKAAMDAPIEFDPGTSANYLSSDYWILQYIIEESTHMNYYDALKKYVLEPLQMDHTFVNYNSDKYIRTHAVIPKEATVYAWENDHYMVSDMQFGPTGYTAGGIYTSIKDFSKIAQTLDRGDFLKPATQELLIRATPFTNGEPGPFGMGPVTTKYQGHVVSGHTGGPALAEFVRFNDEKYTFISLSNQRGFNPIITFSMATFFIDDLQMPEVP